MNNWDDLRVFLAIARAGTLSGAAKSLHVGVSTVHRQIHAFEDDIRTELFERSPRGYRLTHVGEALLPRAEEVEEAVFAANRAVVGHDQQASGEVRITLPLVLLPTIAGHLAEFTRRCTNVRPVLQADDHVFDLGRETDIALRATTNPVDSAIGRKLCDLAWGRFASACTAGDDLPWIHYVGMDGAPAVQWRRRTHPDAEPMMTVRGVMGMLTTLPSAGAQGLLPCFAGDAHEGLRRIGEPVASNELWILVHADLRRSARVRAVLDFLVPRIVADRARYEGSAVG